VHPRKELSLVGICFGLDEGKGVLVLVLERSERIALPVLNFLPFFSLGVPA
jgi:hypothetical protein